MMSTNDNSTILHADQEHAGLRTAVFILLFVALFLAYFAIRAVIGALTPGDLPDYTFVIACGGAFPIALGLVWLAENVMKRRWPSGRSVTLTNDGIQAKTDNETTVELSRDSNVAPLFWHFELHGWQRGGRERRVPRNWLCLAVQLKAGKKEAIVYTYLPRNKAENWLDNHDKRMGIQQIFPKEVYDNSIRSRLSAPSRPEVSAAVLTSKSGKHWLAERRRWQEGFELPPKEFEQFMTHIQAKLL
jgi:hypothetical protein